jgi:hypothetical protein
MVGIVKTKQRVMNVSFLQIVKLLTGSLSISVTLFQDFKMELHTLN